MCFRKTTIIVNNITLLSIIHVYFKQIFFFSEKKIINKIQEENTQRNSRNDEFSNNLAKNIINPTYSIILKFSFFFYKIYNQNYRIY